MDPGVEQTAAACKMVFKIAGISQTARLFNLPHSLEGAKTAPVPASGD